MNEQINKIISEISMFPKEQIAESDILKDLGVDSIKMVEIIIALEENFSINFTETDLNPEKLITVKDIVLLVERYMN